MEKIDDKINQYLKDFFGFKKFKGHQKEAIKSIMSGMNTFVIMPTGGGKSLCYQLPALILDGVAIIISPLIALMKNQVDVMRSHASNKNIAHFFNSSLSKAEKNNVKKHVLNQTTKLLFLAPETINKKECIDFLKNCQISFFAVDEAHCISEWGHDFRPDYKKLKITLNYFNTKPIIALTATATEKVKIEIEKSLGIENSKLFISSFNRPNLYYEIQNKKELNKDIIKFVKKRHDQSGIIYCLARKKAEEISELLNLNNITSLPYHAGLDRATRINTQDAFLMQKVNVIVATIAFGMGIDKPDVRYVIHYNLPKSLENYYQETGRAGRDGGDGHCLLFYGNDDVEKFQNFNSKKIGLEKEIATQLLDEIIAYVESTDCRRKKILHYFNEHHNINLCDKKCDNCNLATKHIDFQKELRLILTGLLNINNKFDIHQLTSILNGTGTSKINNCKISDLICFNKLSNNSDFEIKQIIRKAITENLIKKDISIHGKLKITNNGKLFLKKRTSFLIRKNIEKDNIKSKIETSFDPILMSLLKDIRKEIALQQNIPPFIIFQDPSLEDMTIQYPTTKDELKNIIGVGSGKVEKYGDPFIKIIREYVRKNNIVRVQDYIVKSKPKKNDLKIFIIQSADKKLTFDEIIDQKKITMETLISEIESIVNSGTKINIDYHLNYLLDENQQEEIYDYFIHEAENDSIIDAQKYFDEEYEENELRLMKIKLFSDLAN